MSEAPAVQGATSAHVQVQNLLGYLRKESTVNREEANYASQLIQVLTQINEKLAKMAKSLDVLEEDVAELYRRPE